MKTNMAPVCRVAFRAECSGQFKGHVTAVLPDCPANFGYVLSYAHIGQHSEASWQWYYGTRRATPQEYAPLLKELRGIYEREPDAVRLRVVLRITRNT